MSLCVVDSLLKHDIECRYINILKNKKLWYNKNITTKNYLMILNVFTELWELILAPINMIESALKGGNKKGNTSYKSFYSHSSINSSKFAYRQSKPKERNIIEAQRMLNMMT